MYVWERRQPRIQPLVALEDLYTPRQLAQLLALRARSRALRFSEESGLDLRRLLFAQWLVEHGRLSEEC